MLRIPVLDALGFIVQDSDNIICYLAREYDREWYPQDSVFITRGQEWLSTARKNED